ncbi:MAG TPA: dihydrolipoamide acetyltransferase family protein [Pseudonocardiaceae bacterium]
MSNHQVFLLPDLGEGLTEAEVVSWKVKVGDEVQVDQVIAEVETAKAVVEVPCPYAGTVAELHGQPGQVLSVGQPLITIAPPQDAATANAERYRQEERAGSGAVLIGYGTGHGGGRRRRRRASRGTAPALSAVPDAPSTTPAAPEPAQATPPAQAPRVLSPLVRRLAREHGVDLASLTGTGLGGVVLRRDVEAAIAAARSGTARVERVTEQPDVERIPLRGLRRTVAEKLVRSRQEIPDATTWVDVDATGLIEARDALRAAHPDRRIGILALLARFVVAGLARFPELNAQVDTEREEIVRIRAVHLGFAAQTDRGLVVPVVRNAHRMTTAELADELARLTALAREGRLAPEDMTGGTFTLNNYGVFGVDGSSPIINHPEAAILGVGRIIDRPWAVDGRLEVRKVTQLSLAFDHRVCDGGVAGGFLRYVADCVERPLGLLADL